MPSFILAGSYDEEGNLLYWENGQGWGARSTATVFTLDEIGVGESFGFPMFAAGLIRVS